MLFEWVAGQPGITGAVILAAGLLSAFYGVRMIRLLLVVYCGGIGYMAGGIAAGLADLPPATAVGGCLFGAIVALAWQDAATVLASGATWAVLGAHLAEELDLRDYLVWSVMGLGGGIAALMTILCRRSMTILLTSLHGAAMIIVGFVGVTATFLPSVSATFQAWASGGSTLVSLLIGMLVATGYSCQANFCQGNIVTGAQAGPRQLPRVPKNARALPARKFS